MKGRSSVAFMWCLCFAAASCLAHAGPDGAASSVDTGADRRTRDVLLYLSLVSDRADHRVVLGQFAAQGACCSDSASVDQDFRVNIGSIVARTGRVPGMIGVDYNDVDPTHHDRPADLGPLNSRLLEYARQGSLVTISYHARNPWTGGAWNDGRCPGALTDIIDPKKPVNAVWRAQLDRVAAGLQQLRDGGVTVLWRPFLEANSAANWWWQACRPSAGQFIAVWKDTFDYLTTTKNLHNLIWVYSPVTFVGANRPPLELYPGNGLVDVVGYDTYHDNADWPDYAQWSKLGKVLAYPERGPHSTDGKSLLYDHLLDDLDSNHWRVSYVQFWFGDFHPLRNPGGDVMLRDQRWADQGDVRRALACLSHVDSLRERRSCVLGR